MDDVEILVGHTADEHGPEGPVHHAWRCGWSEPNPELVAENDKARTEAVDRGVTNFTLPHPETRSRVPVELYAGAGAGLVADRFGHPRLHVDGTALSACGIPLPHRTATQFDPSPGVHPVCEDCTRAVLKMMGG